MLRKPAKSPERKMASSSKDVFPGGITQIPEEEVASANRADKVVGGGGEQTTALINDAHKITAQFLH